MPTFNEKSTFTAHTLAYRRTFTDIPLSHEIFAVLEEEHPLPPEERERGSEPSLIPFFEARYLMTDRAIARAGVRQVVELAAGLSPRGILATRGDLPLNFIEVDLRDEILLKKKLIDRLVQKGILPKWPPLRLLAGSALDPELWERVKAVLRYEPVAVVCEGLLRYLSFDDKRELGRHIHKLLQHFGGVWITPDYEVKNEELPILGQAKRYADLASRGIDVAANLFQSGEEMIRSFEETGFAVEKTSFLQIRDALVSGRRLGLNPAEVIKYLSVRAELVMRPACVKV